MRNAILGWGIGVGIAVLILGDIIKSQSTFTFGLAIFVTCGIGVIVQDLLIGEMEE